jgi:putative ABC transport system permease protein
MLSNYLTIAVRHLTRQKLYSLINIFGLSVGIAACIIALIFIQYELSFDTFHSKANRTYRVLRQRGQGDKQNIRWLTSGALARAIEADYPQIEMATKSRFYEVTVSESDRDFRLSQGHIDEHFLDVFDFPFIRGSRATAFPRPNTIVITEDAASRVFGDDDPMGRILTIETAYYGGDYTVTGVIRTPPKNSSLQFDLLHQTDPVNQVGKFDWTIWQPRVQNAGIQTFVLLNNDIAPDDLEAILPDFIGRYMGEEARQNITYRLQPLLRWHLYSAADYNIQTAVDRSLMSAGDIQQIYAFAAIAVFILLIACINFTNLATARSVSRSREVGLRKVIGAARKQIIRQFFGESLLLASLAVIAAGIIVRLFLPQFNTLAETLFTFDTATALSLVPALVLLVLIIGLLAGMYPALFLSAYQPVEVFQKSRASSSRFRQGLVVFQFALSIVLVIGTGMVGRQVRYMTEKGLGFEKEHFLVVPIFNVDRQLKHGGGDWLTGRYNVVKSEFTKHPDILSASAFRFLPGQDRLFARLVKPEGHEGTEWRMPVQECDESFIDAFGIQLLSGRTFSPDNERDRTHSWILNETAVSALGWTPENAVGRRFGRARSEEDAKGEVIGVVSDFHFAPLHHKIGPAVLGFRPWFYEYVGLRITGNNVPETIAFIEAKWREFIPPDHPPEVQFLDDRLDLLYENERRLGRIVGTFSALAILLGCLGLFGLASFTAEQRIREIGIRKTLGASSESVLVLLSADFAKLVAIGCVVAWPAAYYLTQRWLDDFAYRTSIDPWIFVGGGLGALAIALLTVSYQAIRAARTDPVETLRYE